jgi:neutral ceramidase
VKYEDDVDKTLTLLRFQRASDGKNIGVLTWFPVHPTSLLGNNTHVAGDNKGVAAYLFEQSVKDNDQAADGFVAGFSQANVGDTSPNVLGAYCDDGSGQMCDFMTSTCADGKSQACHGRGPEFRKLDLGVSSCFVIGERQFSGAKNLYVRPPLRVRGDKADRPRTPSMTGQHRCGLHRQVVPLLPRHAVLPVPP